MTRLRCVCGAELEGSDEELLAAVERHVAETHPGLVPGWSEQRVAAAAAPPDGASAPGEDTTREQRR